jgi:hypothetical protein
MLEQRARGNMLEEFCYLLRMYGCAELAFTSMP